MTKRQSRYNKRIQEVLYKLKSRANKTRSWFQDEYESEKIYHLKEQVCLHLFEVDLFFLSRYINSTRRKLHKPLLLL